MRDFCEEKGIALSESVDGWSQEKMKAFVEEHEIPCPSCGKHNFTDIRQFNLMFKTFQGVTEDAKNTVYLRPETAQGIFVNFKNVLRDLPQKGCPSALDRSASPSEMRLRPEISPSVPENLNRWSWNFFCQPGTDLEWFPVLEELLHQTGLRAWG